jgi:hypothetical protein
MHSSLVPMQELNLVTSRSKPSPVRLGFMYFFIGRSELPKWILAPQASRWTFSRMTICLSSATPLPFGNLGLRATCQ